MLTSSGSTIQEVSKAVLCLVWHGRLFVACHPAESLEDLCVTQLNGSVCSISRSKCTQMVLLADYLSVWEPASLVQSLFG